MLQSALCPLVRPHEGIDDGLFLLVCAELNTFLHDVASELMLRELHQLCRDQRDDLVAIFQSAVLNDVLRYVIAILIDNERCSAGI